MSRGNTPPPPAPNYAEWVEKYRANGKRERELHIAALRKRGPLPPKESRDAADYAWDAVADADGDEYERNGDEGFWGHRQ